MLVLDFISKDKVVEAARVEAFLTLVASVADYSHEDYYSTTSWFLFLFLVSFAKQIFFVEGFQGKPASDEQESDVFALLVGVIIERKEEPDFIPALTVLNILSRVGTYRVPELISSHIVVEENKDKLLKHKDADRLVQSLKAAEDTDANGFIVYRHILSALRNVLDTKARKLAFIKSGGLDHLITFLRAVAKSATAKKTKEIRVHWLPMRDEGALLLHAFHTEFYDKGILDSS